MTDHEAADEELREWCRHLAEALGVPEVDVDLHALLGLAGRAARTVLRPAAPLTTFIVGYSAGVASAREGLSPDAAVKSATDAAVQLCKDMTERQPRA